ncbi:MAG: thiamine pyrophosphate-dependent dehydrogenase E1 component subunit alpha [Dehalococcoidales bacterium]
MEIPSKETLLKLFRDLLTARRVETRLYEIAVAGGGSGGHRGPGEEVIPIGICNNLTETDCFHPNFRTAFCLFTKPPFELTDTVAMGLGKKYKNIPWMTPKYGTIGSSGTLGEPAVMYLGMALANTIRKTGDVTVFVQGDGASSRAPSHEAMVVAAAWQLPIVFVIQNNQYGMGTSASKVYHMEDISVRGAGYGMPHEQVDGNDMIAMYLVAKRHIERCRAGGGPSLIAANTYRLRPHYEGDPQIYRPKGEMEDWQKHDPLPRYTRQLMELGVIDEAYVQNLETEVAAEIDAAVATVEGLPGRRSYQDLAATAIAEL